MSGSTSSNNVIGSGSDSIVLNLSEDQAEGQDAQFTVNVDGQQIGGLQTVTASHSAGQDQSFTFQGNYGTGPHNVVVTFANNLIYPGDSGDRNLYVDGVSYDGQTVSSSTTAIYNGPLVPPNSTVGTLYGNAVYTVNDTTPIPAGASPNATSTPGPVSVGSGADTLVLNMAEDPFQGDAQFTVSVDGQQIGGTQTTTALFDQGQSQEFDVHGTFGSGTHSVSVNYLNDAIGGVYPGTQLGLDTADRNLYVMGMTLDGGSAGSGAPYELANTGTANFSVTAGSNSSATGSGTFGTDGAAATSNNAAVTSDSLSAGTTTSGSSSGMSFVAPSTTSGTTTTSAGSTNASSGPGSSSGGSTTDTTSTAASTVSAATQTTQDYSVPSSGSSSSNDPTSSASGSSGSGFTTYQQTHVAGSAFHQHG